MATVTEVTLTCNVRGNAEDVKTWAFGLDAKAHEIDLCCKDGTALGRVAAGYIAKARKVTARRGHRRHAAGLARRQTTAKAVPEAGPTSPRTYPGPGRVPRCARRDR